MKVILISQGGNNHISIQSLSQGANGFVSTYDPIQTLIAAIGCVSNNVNYLPGDILDKRQRYVNEQDMLSRLTDRENLILRQLAQGKSNKTIAYELGLNNKTISTYKTKIFQKLESKNLFDIIELARRNGAC